MGAGACTAIAVLVFAWGLLSARLARADLSAPIVFVAAGLLLSDGVHVVDPEATKEIVKLLAEITLVWVLFSDAARVGLTQLRTAAVMCTRLLAVGLPLTILAGALLAMVLIDDTSFWPALIIGAALAPTDAALGAAVMTDPAVPAPVRRVLNVESGLNDGIVTPVVSVAIAGTAASAVSGIPSVGSAVAELLVGLAIGLAAGVLGGCAMRFARRRGWAAADFAGPAVLALALGTYAGTVELSGNGFVAAFVAGLAFGNTAGRGAPEEVAYVEQTAGLASLLTWLAFGAVAVPHILDEVDWRVLLYAVLSVTVVRMVPVAIALFRSGSSVATVVFIGWFGPRGLASIIFALLALEELGDAADRTAAVIGTTVLLSVLAHGLSARPLASRYGASLAASRPPAGGTDVPFPVRRLVQRRPDTAPNRKGAGAAG